MTNIVSDGHPNISHTIPYCVRREEKQHNGQQNGINKKKVLRSHLLYNISKGDLSILTIIIPNCLDRIKTEQNELIHCM